MAEAWLGALDRQGLLAGDCRIMGVSLLCNGKRRLHGVRAMVLEY